MKHFYYLLTWFNSSSEILD